MLPIFGKKLTITPGVLKIFAVAGVVIITTTIGLIIAMILHINRRKPVVCSPGIRHAITALG